jgi:folylpolyglutamate synthase/dihydropteroate synthase
VKHPGRLQYILPNLLIDGAHNELWFIELKKYINQNIKTQKICLCFAQKKGKSAQKMLETFWYDSEYILVESTNVIMIESVKNLKKYFPNNPRIECLTPGEILEKSRNNSQTFYVVFWSLYMIWEFST